MSDKKKVRIGDYIKGPGLYSPWVEVNEIIEPKFLPSLEHIGFRGKTIDSGRLVTFLLKEDELEALTIKNHNGTPKKAANLPTDSNPFMIDFDEDEWAEIFEEDLDPKCECGAEAVGGFHSKWCPKYVELFND